MHSANLIIFNRTPLHVGAGASVGAIDQPVIRERHTGLPIIPGSSLKGSIADLWRAELDDKNKRRPEKDITWLFGSDESTKASAGALSFGEARLLAFPIRSARGSYAWITSPLLISRAAQVGIPGITPIDLQLAQKLAGSKSDSIAVFNTAGAIDLPIENGRPKPSIVLEDYVFTQESLLPAGLAKAIGALVPDAAHFNGGIENRLVILSDGMMSFFARSACEVAQHVTIDDATGAAAEGLLFNQENVPSDTLFYSTLHAFPARSQAHRGTKKPEDAFAALKEGLASVGNTIQIGGDATTGLGFCSVNILP
jgi:CRISPR-associated protein Cmr4